MHRRAVLVKGGAALAWAGVAPDASQAAGDGAHLRAWLDRWLKAFNAPDLRVYQAFVRQAAPTVAPYLDEDLSVRETTGGAVLISAEITGPEEITAVLQDRAWDRRFTLTLRAAGPGRLDDIAFSRAPNGPPIPRLDARAAVAQVRRKLAREGHAGLFSGSVLIARDETVLLSAAHGLADASTPNTQDTRYCIGSMGKLFTAVAVMQTVEAGQIDLDAPIRAYLPDYPNAALARDVRVSHLLTHTGGTGDIFGPAYDGQEGASDRPADLIKLYGDRATAFAPGARWAYSNYGFVLLGAVLEAVRGKPYAQLLQAQIFGPAGMASTSLAARHPRPAAISYTGARRTGLKPQRAYVGLPAGGAYSTTPDLHAFVVALRSGRLVRPDTLRAMTMPRVQAGAAHWGLGVAIRQRNGLAYYGHGGAAPGVSADLAVFPAYATIVLANRGHPAAACVADFIGTRLPVA